MSSAYKVEAQRPFSTILADYGVLLLVLVLIAAFTLAMPTRFAAIGNLQSILGDQAIPGILALACVLPLSVGEFDLSVAANLGFCSVVSAELASRGLPPMIILLAVAAIGLVVGGVNAMLVVGIRMNAFVATLGTSTVLAGAALWVTNGETLFQGIQPAFTDIATIKVGGVQIVFVYFAVFVLLLWYVLERTPFGRYLRATGLGREAARLSGVSTSRYLAVAFVFAGVLAGLCGGLTTARFGSATAATGADLLLPAYAAAFIGSTTIKRGMFNVFGTVIGLYLLAVGINGLNLAGAPFWLPQVFNGLALIVAVSFAVIASRRGGRHPT